MIITTIKNLANPKVVVKTLGYVKSFIRGYHNRFWQEMLHTDMAHYQKSPTAFAVDILNSRWWSAQEEIAKSITSYRRVAVKSANGVGKTYLAADLALWFLYTHPNSIVLTTAPTWRQVRHVLWESIRRKHANAKLKLYGKPLAARLKLDEGWYAMGLAAADGVRFQGFHAAHMLIILDEASGIREDIWEAIEGVAVGKNNKILAIGNPLITNGRFYSLFQDTSIWRRHTISAMDHPNLKGKRNWIAGCVTEDAVAALVDQWCEPIFIPPELGAGGNSPPDSHSVNGVGAHRRVRPIDNRSREPDVGTTNDNTPSTTSSLTTPDNFIFRGQLYRPNNLFKARVLGQFPSAGADTLIPLAWIEAATLRTLPEEGVKIMAVDVARYGSDYTVVGVSTGPVLTHLEAHNGLDNMEVAGIINRLAYDQQPESIMIDSAGLGSGVVDRLFEIGLAGICPVNSSTPATESDRYINSRAELYWNLRERFRLGDISIPADAQLIKQLASIRYRIASNGKIQMESKDDMKRRGESSPDHADMLAMLFDSSFKPMVITPENLARLGEPSESAQFRDEMNRMWPETDW